MYTECLPPLPLLAGILHGLIVACVYQGVYLPRTSSNADGSRNQAVYQPLMRLISPYSRARACIFFFIVLQDAIDNTAAPILYLRHNIKEQVRIMQSLA